MATAQVTTGYAPVNGMQLYYEVHGAGAPLVLLHGGFGTIEWMFGDALPTLAQTRQVIAVELQAHGHTADIDRPMTYELLGDDVAALIRHLGVGPADVLGYSFGGGAALQTAMRHPELVRKLVLVGAAASSDGWYPEVLAGIRALTPELLAGSPMHAGYLAVAPRPADWPRLVTKLRDCAGGTPFDFRAGLAGLSLPVQIIVGDADSIRLHHAVEMFELLGGGKGDGGYLGRPASALTILPNATHVEMLQQPVLWPLVTAFLDAPGIAREPVFPLPE